MTTTYMKAQTAPTLQFRAKEPISALTHFIGFVAAIPLLPILLIHAAINGADTMALVGMSIFMCSMILLYGASTAYHSFDISHEWNMRLKKLDHCSVCVLIAGTYTPICLTLLRGTMGYRLLSVVWAVALAIIVFKLFWVTCPKWVSSVLYIGLGWAIIPMIPELIRVSSLEAFLWLLAGGIMYTVGGVIYAMKFPVFGNRFPGFGCHELFHLFVLAGSLCQYIMIYNYTV